MFRRLCDRRERSHGIGIKCIRLTRGVPDLCNPEHVKQAIQQLESLTGADASISITCTYFFTNSEVERPSVR